MKTPILRKIDSKGKTRVWYAEKIGTSYTTYSGVEGGSLISKSYTPTAKGKNSITEQVEKDMKSKERKKHERELYSYDLSKPHPLHFIAPQLARDYTKVPHQIDWANKKYVAQAKLDGVRTIAQLVDGRVQLTSRKGKRYKVEHIERQLAASIFQFAPDMIIDGELYIHNMELGDITHSVANNKSTLQYHMFDLVDEYLPFLQRMQKLRSTIQPATCCDLYTVHDIPLTKDTVDSLHDAYVNQGYEGLIMREAHALYEVGKRPLGLFKYKKFITEEFELLDILPDSEDGCRFLLKSHTGDNTFLSRPMGTNATRNYLLHNKLLYIGAMVTVKFSKFLASGLPEFNRVINTDALIRDYE